MTKLAKKVIFEISDLGSFQQGFSVKLLIKAEASGKLLAKAEGRLSPTTEIPHLYQQWRDSYLSWGTTHRWWGRQIEVPSEIITNTSTINQCQQAARYLIDGLNRWLNQSNLKEIEHTLLVTVNPQELVSVNSVRFILQTQNLDLQRLPWNEWHFLQERYSNPEMALSITEIPHKKPPIRQIRVLAILGSDENIDIQTDLSHLNKHLRQVAIEILGDKDRLNRIQLRNKLRHLIKDKYWDLIFFAGHSSSTERQYSSDELDNNPEGEKDNLPVKIWVNQDEYFSPQDSDFRKIFRDAVKKGLKLAIFNSCDGLGLARQLADLQIPHIIVFKERVHDRVAQAFLEQFLKSFAMGNSLHLAVSEARQWLQDELEDNSPGSCYLPAVFVNPEEPPFTIGIWVRKMRPLAYLALIFVAVAAGTYLGQAYSSKRNSGAKNPNSTAILACDLVVEDTFKQQDNPDFSCGENILLTEEDKQPQSEKSKGVNAFARAQYNEAFQFFKAGWNGNEKDPETLIYLNNAKVLSEHENFRAIAVIIPSNLPIQVPTSLLKGVAYIQDRWNHNQGKQWKLLVVIVRDGYSTARVPNSPINIAQEVVKRKKIIAAVGPYSSKVTSVVKDIYKVNRFPFISPTATASSLTSRDANNFFFRVGSVNSYAGQEIANYLASRNLKKVIIFNNYNDTFSDSIAKETVKSLNSLGISPIESFDLTKHYSQASSEIAEAQKVDATALIMFPGAYTDRYDGDHTRELIKQSNGKLPIIANEVVYDEHLLRLGLPALNKMIISLPWHVLDRKNKNPQLLAEAPDWWGSKKNINWRIVLAADATKVLITALSQTEPDRIKVRQVLANPNFKTEGITGDISFNGSDRRQRINVLVEPECNLQSKICYGIRPVYK